MLKIKGLVVKDSTGEKILNINLNLSSGGVFALVGRSNAGKSMLMKAISGHLPKSFTVSGELHTMNASVFFQPQEEHAFVRFPSGLNTDEHHFFDHYHRASNGDRSIVLLDEPNPSPSWNNFLTDLRLTSKSLVMLATHNLYMIRDHTDYVIAMKEGRVYKLIKTSDFFTSKDKYVNDLIKMGF